MSGEGFALGVKERSNYCVFPNNLTVDKSAHDFVILSDFVAHLTNDLNPKISSRVLEAS